MSTAMVDDNFLMTLTIKERNDLLDQIKRTQEEIDRDLHDLERRRYARSYTTRRMADFGSCEGYYSRDCE